MNSTIMPLSSPEGLSHPPLAPLLQAVGDPLRWKILAELSAGESLMVKEIAERVGRKASLVSKHLAVLRDAGAVVVERRLYKIPSHFMVAPDKRHLDFGHCLLRLPMTAK